MDTKVEVNTGIAAHFEAWLKLSVKANLKGEGALEAVKQNGYALMYVKEQIFGKETA